MWTQDRICSSAHVMDLERGIEVDIFEPDLFLNLYVTAIDKGFSGFLISAQNIFGKNYRVHFLPSGLVAKSIMRHVNRNRCIHYFYDVNIHFDRQTGLWGESVEEVKELPPITVDLERSTFSQSICDKVHPGLHEKRKGSAMNILARAAAPASSLHLTDEEIAELEEVAHWESNEV